MTGELCVDLVIPPMTPHIVVFFPSRAVPRRYFAASGCESQILTRNAVSIKDIRKTELGQLRPPPELTLGSGQSGRPVGDGVFDLQSLDLQSNRENAPFLNAIKGEISEKM